MYLVSVAILNTQDKLVEDIHRQATSTYGLGVVKQCLICITSPVVQKLCRIQIPPCAIDFHVSAYARLLHMLVIAHHVLAYIEL